MVQTPAFVERMDEADDAVGRVAIFSVEAAADVKPLAPPNAPGVARLPAQWIGAVADDPLGAAVAAIFLILLLVLGLRLTH
ncbi:MAG TPA: hypothetical protein VIG86_07175 [Candidatus Dormibacteraeota bacterium]